MESTTSHPDKTTEMPLYRVVIDIAALWTLFNIGYYISLPLLGFTLSYNSSPIGITLYYLLCAGATVIYFWDIYKRNLVINLRTILFAIFSIALSTVVWVAAYAYSLFPALHGTFVSSYTDIILSTPWYFLPKSIEILIQQLLITALVLELFELYKSLKAVIIGYIICFGGAHIILFFLNGSPLQYSTLMTIGAVASTAVFPYLILKVRSGFMYAYAIHFLFYIILAAIFHLFPPPGYIF